MPNPVRRAIPGDAVLSTWSAPDDWPIRRFDWRARGRQAGSILFLGGRGDIFEKYLEAFDHWHARGWSITAIDWRGHGGSGRLTGSALVGHLDSFEALVSDLGALWSEWCRSPAPRVVMGHSMGGHTLLRALAEEALAPDAAVLLSPMLKIRSPLGSWLSERVARHQCRRGDPGRPAWSPKGSPAAEMDAKVMLTSDFGRLLDEQWWHERMPEVEVGAPSWGWLAEAFASTRQLRRSPALEQVRTPILMLLADRDRLTSSPTAAMLARRLPRAEVVRFKGAAHELLREADPIRLAAMEAIDRFLAEVRPAS